MRRLLSSMNAREQRLHCAYQRASIYLRVLRILTGGEFLLPMSNGLWVSIDTYPTPLAVGILTCGRWHRDAFRDKMKTLIVCRGWLFTGIQRTITMHRNNGHVGGCGCHISQPLRQHTRLVGWAAMDKSWKDRRRRWRTDGGLPFRLYYRTQGSFLMVSEGVLASVV
ncbi:hypothetical protein EW146_g518 [Bondarzewia mesenterica]|uniref:Uncharacterized protein n=1 Tax=Bondarzewia mesenterica TaxID=1095465 RepID=A0A4S4M6P9_9AGAM|nr:hypothetical protein EW146_g518 [Bondarzewia mesenterica]